MQLAYIVIDKKGKVKSPRRHGYHRYYDLPRSIQSVPPPVSSTIHLLPTASFGNFF